MLGRNNHIRADSFIAFFINADINERHDSALIRSRFKNMHRLVAGYRKSVVRLEEIRFYLAAVALKSARNVDGKFFRSRLCYIIEEF